MITDKQTTLSKAQNLAQAAGSYLSTNTIDMRATGTIPLGGSPIDDLGRGEPVNLLVQVVETFTSGGAGTLQAQIIQADDAALTTNVEVLQESRAYALAKLVAGFQFEGLGRALPNCSRRYLGVRYVIATAAMTAGKCDAGIVVDRQTNPAV